MNEIWMLDYLNAVFPYMGVFESEAAAMAYVQTHDPDRKHYYTPFMIRVNTDLSQEVRHTAPYRRYANQR